MRKAEDDSLCLQEKKAWINLDFGFGIKLLQRASPSPAMRTAEEATLLEVFKLICCAHTEDWGKAAENSSS